LFHLEVFNGISSNDSSDELALLAGRAANAESGSDSGKKAEHASLASKHASLSKWCQEINNPRAARRKFDLKALAFYVVVCDKCIKKQGQTKFKKCVEMLTRLVLLHKI
jgi:hypothetical protein